MDTVAGGSHDRIDTPKGPIHLWVPPGATSDVVIYLHGFNLGKKLTPVYVDQAWTEFKLPDQFAASGAKAVFLTPAVADGSGQGVRWASLSEVLDATGTSGTHNVTLVAHSGGYAPAAVFLRDPRVERIVLLDALYGNVDAFRQWVSSDPSHKLDLIVTKSGAPRTNSEALVKSLTPAAKARTTLSVSYLTHMGLITSASVIPELLKKTSVVGLLIVALGISAWYLLTRG